MPEFIEGVTHALTMNGRIHGELRDPDASAEDVIRRRLALLDGTTRYSLNMWRLPGDTTFDRVDLDNLPEDYIQAAGSRERMTVEVRRIEDGGARHYVVGRLLQDDDGPDQEVTIRWSAYETRVRSREVFGADRAADLFIAYYRRGTLPTAIELRPTEV